MKKVYIGGILFGAGSLIQLISSIIFLFSDLEPRVETCVQIGLLLLTGIFMAVVDGFLQAVGKTQEMTDRQRIFAMYGNRLGTMLLTVENLSVVALTLAYWFEVPFWLHASVVLAFVLSLLICVLVVMLAVRSEKRTSAGAAKPREPAPQGQEEEPGV